jgi:hypothetical protein
VHSVRIQPSGKLKVLGDQQQDTVPTAHRQQSACKSLARSGIAMTHDYG